MDTTKKTPDAAREAEMAAVTTTSAGSLVKAMGKSLVGCEVETEAIGEWSGGRCVVTHVKPDRAAPEIVFQVRRLSDGEEMGVFRNETVTLYGAGR